MMTEVEYDATQIKIERENEEKLKHYPILEKQLDIANKALEEIEKNGTNPEIKTITVLCVNNFLLAHKARIEIEALNEIHNQE